ncbi:G5 domain-containing protein [Neoactinobaculum massilliense]|uniref:aggregation-promoting factor C-terminal-like domain-containing protein n=1 Tax=Neoactinobaculum massilliense TaxID=2364794 RepID=UPI000F52E338|nr:G5 domain-containing protein [Neoactinobaculum massilliense]
MGRHSSAQGQELRIEDLMRRSPDFGARRSALMAERAAFEALPATAAPETARLARTLDNANERVVTEDVRSRGVSLASLRSAVSAFGPASAAVTPQKAVAAGAVVLAVAAGVVGFSTTYSTTTEAHADTNPAYARPASAQLHSVTINFDGTSKTVSTNAETVGGALRDAGITIDGDDKVSAALSASVTDGATISITRVNTAQETTQSVDSHGTKEVQDPNLAEGQKVVTTKGVDGVTQQTYAVTYEDGKAVSRSLTFSVQKQRKVDEVVHVGTKTATATTTDTASTDTASTTPVTTAGGVKGIAQGMLSSYGWSQSQFACLDKLWTRESGWNASARNASSGAYGIPQALPGTKMASAGADWATNPATQIRWGLSYIQGRYGSPCNAWAHSQSTGWY